MPTEIEQLEEIKQLNLWPLQADFIPEITFLRAGEEQTVDNWTLPRLGQINDWYKACKHAEELTAKWQDKAPNAVELIRSIKDIHALLAPNIQESFAGKYRERDIYTWNHGKNVGMKLYSIMAQSDLKSVRPLLLDIAKTHKIGFKELSDFIDVIIAIETKIKSAHFAEIKYIDINCLTLDEIDKKSSTPQEKLAKKLIELYRMGSARLEQENAQEKIIAQRLTSLSYFYHTDQITEEQKQAIRKIVFIPIGPRNIPRAMLAEIKNILNLYKECPRDNDEKIAEFLGLVMYKLMSIVPFSNGNKRTAACVVNIFSRLLNKPGFCFDFSTNPINHPYDNAFLAFSEYPELMTKFMLQRINSATTPLTEAEESSHASKKVILMLQMKSYELFKRLKAKGVDLDRLFSTAPPEAELKRLGAIECIKYNIEKPTIKDDYIQLLQATYFIQKCQEMLDTIKLQGLFVMVRDSKMSQNAQTKFNFLARCYTDQQSVYDKDSKCLSIQTSDEKQAKKLVKHLHAIGVECAKIHNSNEEMPTFYVVCSDLYELIAAEKAQASELTKKTSSAGFR